MLSTREQRPAGVRGVGHAGDVTHPHHRVRRRLDVHELRVRPHGRRDRVHVAGVHVGELDAQPAEDAVEHARGAAVGVFFAHHVVAGREALHDSLDRGESGGERHRVRAGLEGGQVRLQGLARRVRGAAVIVVALRVTHGGLDVRRRLEDRGHDGPGDRLGAHARVDGAGAEAVDRHVLLAHGQGVLDPEEWKRGKRNVPAARRTTPPTPVHRSRWTRARVDAPGTLPADLSVCTPLSASLLSACPSSFPPTSW